MQRHEFNTRRSSILHFCTLAIERKCFNHVCEITDEITLFSELEANELSSYISNKIWLESLKERLQTSSSFATNLQAFYSKLQNWCHKLLPGKVAMFEKLPSIVEKTEELTESLKISIINHL